MKLKTSVLLALSLSIGYAIPAYAMDNDQKKKVATYHDLATVKSILTEANNNVPITPQKRHKKKIEETLEACQNARDCLDIESPEKKKLKQDYTWTQNTDPNLRAFPTIPHILNKPTVKKSMFIDSATKQELATATNKLIDLYNRVPHKTALKSAIANNDNALRQASDFAKASSDEQDDDNND